MTLGDFYELCYVLSLTANLVHGFIVYVFEYCGIINIEFYSQGKGTQSTEPLI